MSSILFDSIKNCHVRVFSVAVVVSVYIYIYMCIQIPTAMSKKNLEEISEEYRLLLEQKGETIVY